MRVLGLTALAVLLLDQVSKAIVLYGAGLLERGSIDVIPPYLNLRMAWNRGVNFGLFANDAAVMRWALVAIAVAISVWVVVWVLREGTGRAGLIGAGLLVGGAIGNAIDRVIYGAVADFLNMSCCGIDNPYAFNVADISIFAGAACLILFTGRSKPA